MPEDPGDPCDSSADLVGRLDVQDRVTNERVILDYKDFTAGERGGADGARRIRLTGVIGISCLGDVSYETLEEVVKPAGGCPTAGRVRVSVQNLSTVSIILYRADGGIDLLSSTGQLLRRFASCDELALQGNCQADS